MRTVLSCFLVLAASVANGATVYDAPSAGLEAWVVPDLSDQGFDSLDLEVISNDIDTTLDYDLSFTGYDASGTLTFVSLSPAIPGIAPAILTYSDITGGTGPDGGHVTMNWFKQDITPALDTDALNTDWDAWLVTMGTGVGTDPRYATVSVPEPATSTLGLLGLGGLLAVRRLGMRASRMFA